ncbi:hypothetical protein [Methylocella tundrae]|uniref:hypothetical protein n=1 Tax=Methylocella tundrae TaxID=227605 RepID=UPI001FCE7A9E|nr:hypothetical protein [Methylocella tundrae]
MKQQKESAAAHGATLACGAGSPAGSDAPRLKKPRRGAFVAKSCGYAVVGILVLALLSGGLLVARLTRGPMSIDGLGPLIADALDQRFGRGYDFTLGQTSMVKHGVSPTLSIDGLSLKDGSGRTIFKAPRAEVSIDLLSLIAGRVVPKRLEVFDVEVRLALLPDGSIAQPIAPGSDETVAITPPLAESLVKAGASPAEVGVAASSPAADQNGSPPAAAGTQPKPRALLVRQMSSALRLLMDALTSPDSQIAAVDRIAISRGRVIIDDRTTHQKVTFDGVNLGFQRNSGSTTFNLAVDGPNGRWSATGLASGAPGAQRSLMLQLQNLSIDEILLATGARSIGADFDMPLSARFSIGLRPDGVLSEAVASFGMGAGYLRFDDPNDEPMMVDSIPGRRALGRRDAAHHHRSGKADGGRNAWRGFWFGRLARAGGRSVADQHCPGRADHCRSRASGPENRHRRLRCNDRPAVARREKACVRSDPAWRAAGRLFDGGRR